MTRYIPRRSGFTLVEIMVVMAIIAFLAAMVMLVAPDILAKDRARDAASLLQGALQNARMRAMRDGIPRGVRLIVDDASSWYTVASGNQFSSTFTIASSYQYLEVPPWLLFNNQSGQAGNNPYLQLSYTVPAGQITNRTCTISNMTMAQYRQVQTIINGNVSALPPTLGLPTLNFWATIVPGSFPTAQPSTSLNSGSFNLYTWPDAAMGAASNWVTYSNSYVASNSTVASPASFGIYQSPRPMLGEPVVNMPVDTCVDLSDGVTQPSFASATVGGYSNSTNGAGTYNVKTALAAGQVQVLPGYDILFSPSGQMMLPYGTSQVYLWVRDPTKGNGTSITNPWAQQLNQGAYYSESPLALGAYTSPQYATFLPAAGEQLLVSIKANSGGTGVSPIFWPTAAIPTPYETAIYAANSP